MIPAQTASLPVLLRTMQHSLQRVTVGDLALALIKARTHVATLHRACAFALNLPLDRSLHRQVADDLHGIRVIGMTIEKHLDGNLGAEHGRTVALVQDLQHACTLAGRLSASLVHPRMAVLMHYLMPYRSAVRRSRLLASELAIARRLAERILPGVVGLSARDDLESATLRSAVVESETGITVMADGHRFALLVLAIAVQALPAPHRSRYLEEFRAELHDHLSWAARTGYVMRLSSQMWSLRRSLPSGRELRRRRRSRAKPNVGEEA